MKWLLATVVLCAGHAAEPQQKSNAKHLTMDPAEPASHIARNGKTSKLGGRRDQSKKAFEGVQLSPVSPNADAREELKEALAAAANAKTVGDQIVTEVAQSGKDSIVFGPNAPPIVTQKTPKRHTSESASASASSSVSKKSLDHPGQGKVALRKRDAPTDTAEKRVTSSVQWKDPEATAGSVDKSEALSDSDDVEKEAEEAAQAEVEVREGIKRGDKAFSKEQIPAPGMRR